jgi:hypothetical protein
MSNATRSPIKDRPLRTPGQSLQEERDSLLIDRLLPALMISIMTIAFAGFEWIRFTTGSPPSPILFTAIAGIALAYLLWVLVQVVPKSRTLRQGIIGERAVGQFLERLREQGYQIFHDVVGSGFNVDHVLVGPAGIFTIETKTWSKPVRGDARVICNADRLRAGTLKPDRNPIIQAKAQSSWLKQLVTESTGRPFEVWPVVLFPGWYVEQDEESRRHLWVLEPKALPAFLASAKQRLSPEDIKLASFHISRFIRSVERERIGG